MTILQKLLPFGIPYALYVAVPALAPAWIDPWIVQAARFAAVAAALAAYRRHYAGCFRVDARAALHAAWMTPLAAAAWILPCWAIAEFRGAAAEPFPQGTAYAALRMANSVLLAAAAEELLFRGHVQPWMRHALDKAKREKCGFVKAAVTALDDSPADFATPATSWTCALPAAILFALGHTPAEYIPALLYYAATAWLFRMTRSIGACFIVHALVNAIVGALALAGMRFLW